MFTHRPPTKLDVAPRPKVRFASTLEARLALSQDPLACVYRRAGGVFVVTAHGTGQFTREEWDRR